jgi:hypothetical protein
MTEVVTNKTETHRYVPTKRELFLAFLICGAIGVLLSKRGML